MAVLSATLWEFASTIPRFGKSFLAVLFCLRSLLWPKQKDGILLLSSTVFNGFLSYTAIAFNIITIQALRKTTSLSKPLKTLFRSLAVSDLCIGLIVQPLYIAVAVMEMEQNTHSRVYSVVSLAFYILVNLLCGASFFGIVSLTVDRFLAIYLHLRYQELVTHKRVVVVVISTWLFSAFVSVFDETLDWIPRKVPYIIFSIFNTIGITTAGLLYCKIYTTVRRHTNQMYHLQITAAQSEEMANAARLRKSAVTSFFVYVVFLVCYLPIFCVRLATMICGETLSIYHLWNYGLTLMFLNSSLNPLIYSWKMRHIRRAVLTILQNILTDERLTIFGSWILEPGHWILRRP